MKFLLNYFEALDNYQNHELFHNYLIVYNNMNMKLMVL